MVQGKMETTKMENQIKKQMRTRVGRKRNPIKSEPFAMQLHTLRVQVPNNHILTQNHYYNSYYPNPKYLIIGYMDPLGYVNSVPHSEISGSSSAKGQTKMVEAVFLGY